MPAPISMRLPEDDLAIIDQAAQLRGRSRTDFMREAALEAAELVLMEQSTIRMSAEDFAKFEALIAGPGAPVPEMVAKLRKARTLRGA